MAKSTMINPKSKKSFRSRMIRMTAIVLCMAMLLMTQSCAAVDAWNENKSFSEVMAAVRTDLFGVTQEGCVGISFRLPMREGFLPITDNSAYDSLKNLSMREAYEALAKNIFIITPEQNDKGNYVMKYTRLPSDLDSTQIYLVKEAVIADHPEAYWLTGDYSIGYNLHDGNYLIMYSQFSYEEIAAGISEINDAVADIMVKIPDDANQLDCEIIVHDALIDSVTYDSAAAESKTNDVTAFGIYGTLVKKAAVCSGYARTTKLLLNSLGINCRTVEGRSKDAGHMWNQVKINGQWYNLDVTWDDPITDEAVLYNRYGYFNITDAQLAADHTVGENINKLAFDSEDDGSYTTSSLYNFDLMECTATEANYYIMNAICLTGMNDANNTLITNKIKELSRTKKTLFYIRISDDSELTPKAVQNWLTRASGGKYSALSRSMVASNNSGIGSRIANCVLVSLGTKDNKTWERVFAVRLVYA